jgi:tripartite-type tricarboxylate transporter receptor subunit TctC
MAESGMANFGVNSWTGLAAPAATPQPIIDKLNSEVNKILALPDVQQRLQAMGGRSMGGSSKQFAEHVQAQIQKWGDIIRAAHIVLD